MGRITKVSGPAVQADNMAGCFMGEVVNVGHGGIMGEIIRMDEDVVTAQVYENTEGLKISDPVERTGELFSVELGPGLLGGVFDGIQRPLNELARRWGAFIDKGARIDRLDHKRKWSFTPVVRPGDMAAPGVVVGHVQEGAQVTHKIMIPPGMKGEMAQVYEGEFTIDEPVGVLADGSAITMTSKWNIRRPRPKGKRLPLAQPMLTGQRVVDTLFPIAQGGVAVIPGGFGAGKTVLEQTLARFAHADIIIYIGCGERGNEMAETLERLTTLEDPRTGKPLMERTILIANTSNMPVAAREASIYTGVTIAEYYRDMGYHVALLADSTSRWAEALREISSRLEEIPGEDGYPTYLAGRLGAFYERAGRVNVAGRPDETGSLTIIGAVSPPGGDFSEPVTQASLRMASTFWELDSELAYQRHFPAINWRSSFSLGYPAIMRWYSDNVDKNWPEMVARVSATLQLEEELLEIAQVTGADSMEDKERVTLESARLIREGYLRQSAVHPTDAYCPVARQSRTLALFLEYAELMKQAVERGATLEDVTRSDVTERLLRLKDVPENDVGDEIKYIRELYESHFGKLTGK